LNNFFTAKLECIFNNESYSYKFTITYVLISPVHMHTRTFFRPSQDGEEKVDVSGVGGEGGGGDDGVNGDVGVHFQAK
jgi:hypothetical protein